MQLVSGSRTRCGVCGFSEVRTDEVVDRGLVFLAECPRCEYRWTSPAPFGLATAGGAAMRPRRAARAIREVAPAA
jgi:hypothetical protein